MKIVYVAGPYQGLTDEETEANVRRAARVGAQLAEMGFMPAVVHLIGYHVDNVISKSRRFWLDGDLELMRRCDAVYAMPGWAHSVGTKAEVSEAGKIGIPVFYTLRDLALKLEVA
jgi:hypothetical protein